MKNETKASNLEAYNVVDHRELKDAQQLLNNTSDLMWSVDKNFKLITSNRAFDLKYKSSSAESIRNEIDVLAIELNFVPYYERALNGETFTEIEYSDTPVETWSQFSFYPIREGDNIVGVTCYSQDITILKKDQHYLKLLESVVTNTTDSIVITEAYPLDDLGPKIVYVNDALLKMTGYTKEEIIGKTPSLLHGPNSDKCELERSIKSLKKSEPCEIEIVNYKKNGEEFCLHVTIAPVTGSDGLPTHFISIGRDVTERIKNIKALKEQNSKLTNIAWVQSHEVRGPLASIMGIVNLLTDNSESKGNVDTDEALCYLKHAANKLDMVIRKIVEQTE